MPRMMKDFRQPNVEMSQLDIGGTINVPIPMPDETMPGIIPLRFVNHLATIDSIGRMLPLIPAPIIKPQNKYNCQMALTCDINK